MSRRSKVADVQERRRRHISYAHVVAVLALFLSLTSGALAARHYLLISVRQIKPSVLSALRAHPGTAGSAGATGLPGAKGTAGEAGTQGALAATPTVLSPGETEAGAWGAGYEINEGRSRYRLTVSFPIPLASPLQAGSVDYLPKGSPPTATCPGVGQAAPGFLCIYEGPSERLRPTTAEDVFDPEEFDGPPHATGRSGFALELNAEVEDPSSVTGTFAVTAARSARPAGSAARGQDGAHG